jgi:signal transduction histidine kinase
MDALRSASLKQVADGRPVRQLMLAEQTQMLYRNVPVSQSVALANGVVLAALLAMVVDASRVIVWLGGMVAVTLARFYLGMRFKRASPATDDIGRWLNYYYVAAGASGAVWGAAAWLVYPHDVAHQVFLAFVLGGMVAGAVSLLTPVFPIFALFAVLALVPTTVRFLATGDYMHYAMGGMSCLFLLAMLATGKRIHDTISQTLLYRFENRELVEDLTRTREHLQAANEDLLRTQQTLRAANEDLERRVVERTAALETADRRKDEFIAMLSHELRNPLAGICTSSYLLRRVDGGSEYAARAREVIERQARYLSRLVDDLLDITRIARGKTTVRRERVDLAACVRRTAEDYGTLYTDLGVHLSTDVPVGPIWAAVDPTRMAQLIGNLLQNAAKFTPSGGHVTLSLRVADDQAEVRVSDTGAGIEPGILPTLFEPFVQGDRSAARIEAGLGLGLALVKGIAELHGGTVRGESEGLGKGATFVVRLPLRARDIERTDSRATGAVMQPARNRSVLVVDDNRDAADSLALLVEAFGHSAVVAYDGPSAVEKARNHSPDVVLCDLGLPGMTGFDVARAIHAQRTGVRMIAVTGYTRPEDMAQATAAGFNAYVVKPPEPEAIRDLLA